MRQRRSRLYDEVLLQQSTDVGGFSAATGGNSLPGRNNGGPGGFVPAWGRSNNSNAVFGGSSANGSDIDSSTSTTATREDFHANLASTFYRG